MNRKRLIFILILILLTLISYTAPSNQKGLITLDGGFVNLNPSIPNTEIETDYQMKGMVAPNYYSYSIKVDLVEKITQEIKNPLVSKITDAKPYYGVWLYGGKNRIPIIASVIQVDESEVPKDKQFPSQKNPYGQFVIISYFKIVFDLNQDLDFTNDEAYYQYVQLQFYDSRSQNEIVIPIKYVDAKKNANPVELPYRINVDIERSYATTIEASQKEINIVPKLSYLTISGTQMFESVMNFGGEMIHTWIVDENLNGVFDNDDIWAVDLNKDKEWDINSRFTIEKFRLDEAVNINKKSYLIAEINPAKGSIKIAESKLQAEPRKIFGVGSEAPPFARMDFISRKLITTIDLKGKPYVIYYFARYFEQRHTKELQDVVTLFDRYIGLKKMSLIIAFDQSNFDTVLEALSIIDLPYYLVKGRSEDYERAGLQREHLLNGYWIDENAIRNNKVLIAVDKNGIVKYINKNAGLDNVVEVCEILQPGSTKEKSKWFLNIFKKEKKKEEIIEAPVKPKTTVEIAFDWFQNNKDKVAKVFEPDRIVYLFVSPGKYYIVSKSFCKSDIIKLPDVKEVSYVRFPRFSLDKKKLYFLMSDSSEQKQYIVSISERDEPKILIDLTGTIMSYDVSPDESEVVYSHKGEKITHLYCQKVGSDKTIQITEDDIGGIFPAYSPDGKWISYVAQKKIRLYNLETSERKIIVDDDLMKEFPEWSPDGDWIIYQGSAGDEYLYDIYKVEVATGKVERLTKQFGVDANPSFSRDGSKIIFISERDTGTNNQTVYIMNTDGTNVERDVTADTGVYFPRQ